MNNFGTYNFAIIKHLNGYVAFFTGGSKYTAGNSTKRGVGKSPGYPFGRNFCGRPCSINTGNLHGSRRTGSIIVIFGIQNSMVEFAGCFCGGNQNNTIDGCTFRTVGRNRTHGVGSFPFPFGNEGRRTTTIAVNSVNATQRKHHFAHFIVGQTGREGSVTAVSLTEYQGTVCFNTDHGTRCVGRSTFYGFSLQYTVFYQPTKVSGNCGFFIAGKGSAHSTKFTRTIPVNSEVSLSPFMNIGSTQNNAVPNHKAVGCVGIIRQGSIHTTNNVIPQAFVVSYGFG